MYGCPRAVAPLASPGMGQTHRSTSRAGSPPDPRTADDDAALVERLMRMRIACQGLAAELASTNRRLKAAEKELNALKRLDKPT